MYEKRDSSQRIADVVHRNTGMDTDTFLHPERMPYLAGLHEAAACFMAHRDDWGSGLLTGFPAGSQRATACLKPSSTRSEAVWL